MWRKVVPDRDPMPLLETSNNTILPPPPMKTTLHIDKEYIKDMIPTTLFESFFDVFHIKKTNTNKHLNLHVSAVYLITRLEFPISNQPYTTNPEACGTAMSKLGFAFLLASAVAFFGKLVMWGPRPGPRRLTSHDNLPYPPLQKEGFNSRPY